MSKMGNFLAVNKAYFGLGLKSIDILIISQIEEFSRNGCKCYLTNKQFADMFGESESTIKRALDKLEELKIIKRDTTFVEGNGRANKQRVITINDRKKWKIQNEPSKEMEGSNVDNGRFKSEEWKVHNEPIKDNLKDNLKENLSKRDLEDLTDEELESIKIDYSKRIDYKTTRNRLRLNRQVTKDTWKEAESILAQRAAKAKSAEIEAQYSDISDEDISTVSSFLRCSNSEVLDNLCALGVDVNYMLDWIPIHGEVTQSIADNDEYRDYRESQGYITYFDVVKMMIKNNNL